MALAERLDCFPSVTLPGQGGSRPVEVALIAQLGVGAGDQLIREAAARQRRHEGFVDALDEPSVRLGAMSLAHGDASTLFSFVVGPAGHPFHRHAGNRLFTAVSGSGGARLRFAGGGAVADAGDPEAFVRALRHVTIPPDCLFTVRFGGGTWHRFEPLDGRGRHPALFALSCHPNELGGELDGGLRRQVEANQASLHDLTELLPEACLARLAKLAPGEVPTVELSLHAAPRSLAGRACAATRSLVGRARTRASALRQSWGFRGYLVPRPRFAAVPAASLLHASLPAAGAHDDCVQVAVPAEVVAGRDERALLAGLLTGFLEHRPRSVAWMMALRNRLVAPWRLRTSPLGCPVSSLLSQDAPRCFAGRFPVLGERHEAGDGVCEVLLGADDRHLCFRTAVGVARRPDGSAVAWLASRVVTRNVFGRLYLAAISATHRRYIAPLLLRTAIDALRGAGFTPRR